MDATLAPFRTLTSTEVSDMAEKWGSARVTTGAPESYEPDVMHTPVPLHTPGLARAASPLLHGTFARFKPEEGKLTNAGDMPTIRELTVKAREQWPELTVGFAPGFEYTGGLGSGIGKFMYADGAVYEGAWRDDCKHGTGTVVSADGSIYAGQWREGKKHGLGQDCPPER